MIEFGRKSLYFSKLVRSKAKMIEFDIPLESHIPISEDAQKSFLGALAIAADTARKYFEDYINHKSFDSQLKNQLHNVAEYFDALLVSGLGNSAEYQDYIAILGTTAYYLGDYNGSSRVMVNYISDDMHLLEESITLVKVFIDVITDKLFLNHSPIEGKYSSELNTLVESYRNYILSKTEFSIDIYRDLQDKVYRNGSDFSVIIVNCLLAVVCKKIDSSSTKLLPEFSGLDFSLWQDYIQSTGSIKELWPSQIELGRKGMFSGKSGIVQMPTSSGKTASINLTLRSAFYSNRIDNALIVAPFRALCREIYRDINAHFVDENNVIVSEVFDLPEIPQDFSIFNDGNKRVFILTPEKLLFLLRNHQSFIDEIGLCIFDEAHLFDDPSRGTNFELLLSTVKQIFPKEIQKILISAVIPNSEAINRWFNEDGVIVSNNSIKTTEKRVAFSDLNGSIDYHDSYRNSTNTQQLDGYFRFEGFDYLVEMKWEKNPVNSPKIASLKQKVDTKLTSTRGLFLSINGFRDEVIQDFSNKDAKILFMDGQELAYILENRISLYEALKVKIIGASKTGNPNVSIINQE